VQDVATEAQRKEIAVDQMQTMFSLNYQEGDNPRWGRRSGLGWDEDVASLKDNDDVTIIQAIPVAAAVSQLSVPQDCQKELLKYLKALSRDPRKQFDVRDMRQMALANPSAASDLQVAEYPDAGIVQFKIVFKFCGGLCKNWFSNVDGTVVTEHLYDSLGSLQSLDFKLPRNSITIKFSLERNDDRWSQTGMCSWLVVVRTESGAQAHTLKSAVEATDLTSALRRDVPIRALLGETEEAVAYKSEGYDFRTTTFDFAMKDDVRVIGGKILDIIDPCRANIDPAKALPEDTPPRWIPALIVESKQNEEDIDTNLRFASEVSGIPWMGAYTLSDPLYHRLAQVLKSMQGLFAKIARPLVDEMGQGKVLVKAQAYVLREGDEIIGQLHQEGVRTDSIESVGLYYPEVGQSLTGGDLEITVVATGGCGSKYPVSKCIPIAAGTAVVFDNLKAFHRMTSLKCARCDNEGHRLVLGFFVLRKNDPEIQGSEMIPVNYVDKAAAMVRLACARKKLPRNVHSIIVAHLAGDFAYSQREFNFSRTARSKPVTHEGLTVMACD
jgi:hypothetical protein